MKKLLLFLVCGLTVSCSSIDCPVQNIVSVQYSIRNGSDEEMAITDSLTITSQRKDGADVILNRLIGLNAFSLPISYSHPEDVLQFTFVNDSVTVTDTVWIKKDDIPHFESVDCSAAFFHRLTGVRYTKKGIDSLVIKNTNVDYEVTTIHFYLYPKSGS